MVLTIITIQTKYHRQDIFHIEHLITRRLGPTPRHPVSPSPGGWHTVISVYNREGLLILRSLTQMSSWTELSEESSVLTIICCSNVVKGQTCYLPLLQPPTYPRSPSGQRIGGRPLNVLNVSMVHGALSTTIGLF